jgi:hypothetical protein
MSGFRHHHPVTRERVDRRLIQHPRHATQSATQNRPQNFSEAETPMVRGVSV